MTEYLFVLQLGIPGELEDKFNALYDGEHVPFIMQTPGVRACTRFRLQWSDNPDMPKYVAIYEIDGPQVVRSEEWQRQGALGSWNTEMRPFVTARRNGIFRRISQAGEHAGSESSEYIYFLQQSVPPALDAKFNQLYDGDHIPLMLQTPGARSCTRYQLEASDSGDVPNYLAIYSIDGPDVPRSREWKQQTELGAWPTQIRPHFSARRNGSFRRIARFKAK